MGLNLDMYISFKFLISYLSQIFLIHIDGCEYVVTATRSNWGAIAFRSDFIYFFGNTP